MSLDVPNLDDQRWANLVADATALIPRHAPRWTDHNVHDPGITFIELFAWLAEMQMYQLNRVGERHREVFGRLAGVPRRLRTPARVDVLVGGELAKRTPVPAGTQLTPVDGDPIVFETTADVLLTRTRLVRVIVDGGTGPVDHTEANEKFGIAFLAFGERADKDAQLQLGFDQFYPDDETIRLTFSVVTDDLGGRCGTDLPVPSDGDGSRHVQPAQLAWEYYRGPGDRWRPLAVVSDETFGLSQSGAVTLTLPDDAASRRGTVWIRIRIVRGCYDIEPRLRHVGVNVLPCEQVETVTGERLTPVTGLPDQSFILAKKPVLIRASQPTNSPGSKWSRLTPPVPRTKCSCSIPKRAAWTSATASTASSPRRAPTCARSCTARPRAGPATSQRICRGDSCRLQSRASR
jgi:hypothetical protein